MNILIKFLALLFFFHPPCLAKHTKFISDYAALLAFKSSLRLEPHNILSTNWSSDTDFCSWYGVSCLHQRVVALQLPNLAIQGRVSSELANLTQLAVLDLSSNDLNGNLPSELGFLQQLRLLNVTRNSLDGTIPPNISRCRLLQQLHLSDNMIKGSIPQELGLLSQLRFLRINNNNLTGKIPSLLGNLSKLEYFYLHENDLEGEIPDEIGDLSNLRLLSFRGNNFTGSIPASIFNISRLQIVDLSINALSGELPSDLGNYLPMLEHLFLDSNRITGKIPVSLSNASKITLLFFTENDLLGNIPSEFGKLHELVWFEFEYNRISGAFPSSLFNISSLEILKARHNYLYGYLPHDLGTWLPNLREIFLSHNQFSGYLPSTICNASKLENLEVANNSFTGPIPMMLGNLVDLITLNLQHNLLENKPGATKLDFLNSLVTSRNLVYLILESNPLNGIFPESIGNLSSNIRVLDAADSGIRGNMPTSLGNLSSLIYLGLASNNLVGNVPPSFIGLQNLERLYLTGNKLEGPFPAELCSIGRLGLLHLGENRLSGAVPPCIGNLTELREMSIAANKFSSKLPSSFWRLVKLDRLNLSRNLLHGFFPSDVGTLKAMNIMDLSFNKFFGEIPNSTGSLQYLVSLDMSRNAFQGPIPDTFSNLLVLEYLDLSTNALSGVIPKSLELLRDLKYLNVSFNNLQGQVPKKGVFANINYRFLMGNPRLCGAPDLYILLCPAQGRKKTRKMSLILRTTVPVAATFLILVALFFTWMIWSRRKHVVGNNESDYPPRMGHQKITYYELLQATENFSQSNLVGSGSSGTVYKGTFSGGTVFAIKVFDMEWQGGLRNFDSECEILSNVRHRNLVKIVSTCSNLDLIAIVLEYMPNGSLDKRLYSDEGCLTLIERLNILIDVALAMEYLHHDYTVPIVHCDLKPANVLLDQDLTAHVADFGIAKMLSQEGNMAQTKTLGTIGYIAPEYGLDGQISTSSDVYSFGILLLETFTRKKPTEDMFSGDLSLHKWISLSFPDAVLDILDANLVSGLGFTRDTIDENQSQIKQLLILIINVAFLCLKELAEERINMREVVEQLKKIRAELTHSHTKYEEED
ncbi:probable LRR receptor-like serine/threonine-protein kinase At3g47570 [Solanum dulcamara]|uniref:probable LRR receptor-like serine/threonine-protein kinase At3g47570 n=1 Tax=Solanum dulcamara TaxID=45834 RepID=UPI002485C199|nr:probable LRR receptor-like serine/threonine-protein kinase At3g47570 [Solanum dulcamara]